MSSKTPNANVDVIVWGRKSNERNQGFSHRHFRSKSESRRWRDRSCSFPAAALVAIALLAGLIFGWWRWVHAPGMIGRTKAKLGSQDFVFELADSPKAREQGLSNRPKLSPKEGMVFVFPGPDAACFWMKDMRFNLDILWFDSDMKMIYQQQDLSPGTYPTSYCPSNPSTYVVEVNAGTASKLNLKIGDPLYLEKQ